MSFFNKKKCDLRCVVVIIFHDGNPCSRRWFWMFCIFTPTWGDDPTWLYFLNESKPPTSVFFTILINTMFLPSRMVPNIAVHLRFFGGAQGGIFGVFHYRFHATTYNMLIIPTSLLVLSRSPGKRKKPSQHSFVAFVHNVGSPSRTWG